MRANSVHIEAKVSLSPEEIDNLKDLPLEGILKFRDYGDEGERDIPLIISYQKRQGELLEVCLKPKRTYFGRAKQITFSINEEFYKNLKERGVYGDGFWGS